MKMLIILVLAIASFGVLGNEEAKKQTLDEVKIQIMSSLDERLANLQAAKNCVTAATSREQIKACRKTLTENQKKVRDAGKAWRENFKADKKAKRDAKRASKKSAKNN